MMRRDEWYVGIQTRILVDFLARLDELPLYPCTAGISED